jgi:hypothetical protein
MAGYGGDLPLNVGHPAAENALQAKLFHDWGRPATPPEKALETR